MFKKTVIICVAYLIISPSLLAFAGNADERNNGIHGTLIVEGVGYPPIKAENVVQARLMARRAAILDAYRNALARKGASGYENDFRYSDLDGFVKGMTIIDEEYLADGGIRITAQIPSEKVILFSSGSAAGKQGKEGMGPRRITLDEWYRIIKKLVIIEE